MNINNEERCVINLVGNMVYLNFEMHPESEFANPHAIIRTRHFSLMSGVVRVFYNTYYIYCPKMPDCAMWIFIQYFPCEPVWSWENE